MAEFESPVLLPQYFNHKISRSSGVFLPSWAASNVQYAENLLECSDEPIEYDDDDEDYQDNCFFFPEDCTLPVRKDSGCEVSDHEYGLLDSLKSDKSDKTDKMTPELPDIKMLDTEALSDLLEDNLSPPEITSILYDSTGEVSETLLTGGTAYSTPMVHYSPMDHLFRYDSFAI